MKNLSTLLTVILTLLLLAIPAHANEHAISDDGWDSFEWEIDIFSDETEMMMMAGATLTGLGAVAATTCNVVYIARGSYRSAGRVTCGVAGTVLGGVGLVLGAMTLDTGRDDELGTGLGLLAAGTVTAGLAIWNLSLNHGQRFAVAPTVFRSTDHGSMPGLVATGRF